MSTIRQLMEGLRETLDVDVELWADKCSRVYLENTESPKGLSKDFDPFTTVKLQGPLSEVKDVETAIPENHRLFISPKVHPMTVDEYEESNLFIASISIYIDSVEGQVVKGIIQRNRFSDSMKKVIINLPE